MAAAARTPVWTAQNPAYRPTRPSHPWSAVGVDGRGLGNEGPNVVCQLPQLFSGLNQEHRSNRPGVIVVGSLGSTQGHAEGDLAAPVMMRIQLELAIKGPPLACPRPSLPIISEAVEEIGYTWDVTQA